MTEDSIWEIGEGHESVCLQLQDKWDTGCQCDTIAKIREDERERTVKMLEALAEAMMSMTPAAEEEDNAQ